MDGEVNTGHNALERMLEDGSAEPMHLPFSFLEKITNCFSDDQVIGYGGFAVVYKGMVGDGMVAVKKLTNTFDLEETKFHKEVECLAKTKHENIVRFLGYCAETQGQIADFEGKFVMADTRNWLLCFEYVPNGSLDGYIADASGGLEWGMRFEIIKGICQGLCYLHDKRILHLDLKPANILIADHMIPKIADFGLSRCLNEEQTRIFTSRLCGTVGYLAPEFFRGQVAFASDIYSLGVIIVEILTGEKGYPEDESVLESWMNRLQGDAQLEQIKVCTKIGIECMELDPKKRPAARHIIDRLDETISIVETGISSPSVEKEIRLLKQEQQFQDRIGNTFAAEVEDVEQRLQTLGNDECQEKEDQWSAWGSQDTKQYRKDASASSPNSGVFGNLSNLDIFNKKTRRNFMRNGGPIIQQSNSVKIFRKEELKLILDNSNLVGRGGFGDVYRGILYNKLVAVRKPIAGSLLHNEHFANEVIRRSQVIHKNIIRLVGCCLEVDIPMLVYEFVSKGSLHDILQSNSKVPLNLGVRLRIAAQAADGLAYMHSKENNKVLVCGLEAANILLDDDFLPKISDFGILRLGDLTADGQPVPPKGDYFVGRPAPPRGDSSPGSYFSGQPVPPKGDYFVGPPARTRADYFVGRPAPPKGDFFVGRPAPPKGDYFVGPPARTRADYFVGRPAPPKGDFFVGRPAPPKGDYFVGRPTPHNKDPVLMEANQLTKETDVYSFGIIMLELISRKDIHDDNNSLVKRFLKFHKKGKKATELFDKEIAVTRDLEILDILAKIAVECLNSDEDARPKMAEVAERLLILSRAYRGDTFIS